MASLWREAGYDIVESQLSSSEAQDGQAPASYPGLYTFSTGQGESALRSLVTSQTIRAENRWAGTNRGGWSNQEYDRLADRLPPEISVVSPPQRIPQARTVGRLAWRDYQLGRRDDRWKLAPIYLRPSYAEEKARKK